MAVHMILLHTTAHNRRVLHQPFFPQYSIPSSDHDHPPLSSSYPNQPSSPSTSFFPDLPPPSPASSSFPAIISPESNSVSSSKLVVVSVTLAVSAVVIIVIALFLYLRRRRSRRDGPSDDSKTYLSSSSDSRASANVVPMPLNNSSEFLYLGTIVNSRGIDPRGFRNSDDTCLRKSDSPELRPLPPLDGQRLHEEDDEEFYSYTSSSSDSPLRSLSLTISPQTSLSPKSFSPIFPVMTQCAADRNNPRSSSLSHPPPPPPGPPPPPPYPVPAYPPPPPPYDLVSSLKAHSSSRPISNLTPLEIPPPVSDQSTTTQKPKLKPLHWDKVRARSDREMVWDQLKSNSFKLNEEMIETLFVVKTIPTNHFNSKEVSTNQEIRVLDPKKAQNIAISLRALNVTIEEVTDALSEGNADALGTELLECLLKMAPTKEEERKLMEYNEEEEEEDDHHSPLKLGQAERFLKEVLQVPFAFKRMNVMLYVANFHSEIDYLNNSFQTLEAACEELRTSRMFLKLLQAVLKTGNRMNVGTNRGDASAFKLDTLLKLVDVKASDGKTTLLHFVVQEMVRTEGAHLSLSNVNTNDEAKCRRLGLQVVSSINIELNNVKKAATMDLDILRGDVSKLTKGIENIVDVIRLNETTTSCQSFSESMSRFVKTAEEEMIRIRAQESVAVSLVKEVTEYFHGNSAKEEAHPFRIFVVVRDFLAILDRVCKEVGTNNESNPLAPWPEKNPHLHCHPIR